MKPHLVLLRTGPDAAYRQIVDRLAEQNFDVAVSWNGTAAPQVPGAAFVHAAPGPRWGGLAQTLAAHAGQWAGYRYVWLPDDGLQWVPEHISRLFSVCEQLALDLAQPAFTPASPGVTPVSLQHAGFQVRFTAAVDPAAPVFSRTLLQQALPRLAAGERQQLGQNGRVAVVDATAITRVAPGEAGPGTETDEPLGITLGGLLDNGDALCFGAGRAELDAMLRVLLQACDGLPLPAASLAHYIAGHLHFAAGPDAAALPALLEQALAGAEMRFNVVLPSAVVPAAPVAPDAALLAADLRDLRTQHGAVVAERDHLAATLADIAQQLQQALPVGRPTMARVA